MKRVWNVILVISYNQSKEEHRRSVVLNERQVFAFMFYQLD